MSRYIDADALIMALRLEYPMMPMFKESRKEWEEKTEGYRKAEEIINDAPTIDAVSVEWIPCEERLPSKDGRYLIVGRQGAVNILPYSDGRWYGRWGVIAWMPLPKPWKGADDE